MAEKGIWVSGKIDVMVSSWNFTIKASTSKPKIVCYAPIVEIDVVLVVDPAT